MLKPSGVDGSIYTLFPLVSAVCFSLSSLLVKKISVKDSTLVSIFYLLFGMMLLTLPSAAYQWKPLTIEHTGIMIAIGALYVCIQGLLIYAYTYAHTAFISPFKLIRFPAGIFVGILYFGESYAWDNIFGGVLICFSCILVLYMQTLPSFLLRFKTR
jgi:drug/metabolite transporter (DMT)-like permease